VGEATAYFFPKCQCVDLKLGNETDWEKNSCKGKTSLTELF